MATRCRVVAFSLCWENLPSISRNHFHIDDDAAYRVFHLAIVGHRCVCVFGGVPSGVVHCHLLTGTNLLGLGSWTIQLTNGLNICLGTGQWSYGTDYGVPRKPKKKHTHSHTMTCHYYRNRNSQDGTLKVDGGKPITRRSPGKLRQLNTDTGLYVGKCLYIRFFTCHCVSFSPVPRSLSHFHTIHSHP